MDIKVKGGWISLWFVILMLILFFPWGVAVFLVVSGLIKAKK